jgi:putative peptidoglycan lipid II flippase
VVRSAAMIVLVGAGGLVYGAAALALGAVTRDDLRLLRRGKA